MKFIITLIVFMSIAWITNGIKIDCDNTNAVNEEHIHYCCKHPDGSSHIMETCSKETGFPLPNHEEEAIVDFTADRAIAGTCFGKCIFTKLNFMTDNDVLNMSAVEKYYKQKYHSDDPEYVKEMISAFDHCHGKSEENTARFLSNPMFQKLSHHFCQPKSSVVWACVIRHFFHNCPADRWSKTKECKDTLAFSKSCHDAFATL